MEALNQKTNVKKAVFNLWDSIICSSEREEANSDYEDEVTGHWGCLPNLLSPFSQVSAVMGSPDLLTGSGSTWAIENKDGSQNGRLTSKR